MTAYASNCWLVIALSRQAARIIAMTAAIEQQGAPRFEVKAESRRLSSSPDSALLLHRCSSGRDKDVSIVAGDKVSELLRGFRKYSSHSDGYRSPGEPQRHAHALLKHF